MPDRLPFGFVHLIAFTIICAAILAIGISVGYLFAWIAAATVLGMCGGLLAIAWRSVRGPSAPPLVAEREPAAAGTIDIARIPVIGIGGLGLFAMAAVVAWLLPEGRLLTLAAVTGGTAGAAAYLAWRAGRGAGPLPSSERKVLS